MATYRCCQAAKAADYEPHAIMNRAFPQDNTTLDEVAASVSRSWQTMAFNDVDETGQASPTKFHPVLDADHARWEKFVYSMLDMHAREGLTSESVIYMHTFSAPALMGLLQYMLTLRLQDRPRVYCLIYCTIGIRRAHSWTGSAISTCCGG